MTREIERPMSKLQNKAISSERAKNFCLVCTIFVLFQCTSAQKVCAEGDCENGIGFQEIEDGSQYIGSYRSGVREGSGKIIYANRDSFEGTFAYDQREGLGTYLYYGGHRFFGDYRESVRQGKGKYSYSEVEYFEGNYEEGVRSGFGIYSYPNGDRFEGKYSMGKRNGEGRYIFADKNILEGMWIDNELEGKAFIKNPKGKIIQEGYWAKSKFVGREEPKAPISDGVEVPDT